MDPSTINETFDEPGRPGRVLLVDNDPDVSELVQAFLSQTGHEVCALGSAESALELIQAEGLDSIGSIVLDLRMPGMGGVDFLSALDGRYSDLPPVVVISGFISEEDREVLEAREEVRALFHKPFDLLALGQALQNLLSETP